MSFVYYIAHCYRALVVAAAVVGTREFPLCRLNNMEPRPPVMKTLTCFSSVLEPPGKPISVSVNDCIFLSLCQFGGKLTRINLLYLRKYRAGRPRCSRAPELHDTKPLSLPVSCLCAAFVILVSCSICIDTNLASAVPLVHVATCCVPVHAAYLYVYSYVESCVLYGLSEGFVHLMFKQQCNNEFTILTHMVKHC